MDAVTAAPTLEELPNLNDPYERKISMKVDYEGSGKVTHIKLIPDFKPVEPTPAEKAILGEKPKSAMDELLAFYHPQRGTEHGVSPLAGGAKIGESLDTSVSIGRSRTAGDTRVSVFGMAGYHGAGNGVMRSGAETYSERGLVIGSGFEHQIRVGYGPPRSKAERALRLD